MNTITRADILSMDIYGQQRIRKRAEIMHLKRDRRIAVGPFVTCIFENRATLLHQIHEMLWIEQGGESQIDDEIAAYAPLVPSGRELVATMMIEIADPHVRKIMLQQLTGIEHKVSLVSNHPDNTMTILAVPENDTERTRADGKTSAVHFIRFRFDEKQSMGLQDPSRPWALHIQHPHYTYATPLSRTHCNMLCGDLDVIS